MKTPRLLQRAFLLGSHDTEADARSATELPELCPAARCERCGYEFTAYTVSAVCPRCLERFNRDPCYGGCFSCPLITGSTEGDPDQ